MQRALDFLRPHRAHRLYPLCFVSELTCTNAKRVFEFLSRETELGAEDIDLIKRLIDECAKTEVCMRGCHYILAHNLLQVRILLASR